MDKPPNFVDTLSSGIQDVAALLPLLGTEQCERHVGSSLQKGFLYAALAPLSIFGSLGIVKAAFAALLATITYPFYGGRWLHDAGFATPGSVSSMATIEKGTGRYGAEIALEKLLKDQHIDDPSLVEAFEWPGWKRSAASGVTDGKGHHEDDIPRHWSDTVKDYSFSWNMLLILSSLLSAILSITPYIYLTSAQWNRPLSWLFPLLRSFGSLACVVATQLALQLRIYRIANTNLHWLKLQTKYRPEDTSSGAPKVLEDRILEQIHLQPSRRPFLSLIRTCVVDVETGKKGGRSECPLTDDEIRELEQRFTVDWHLVLYQVIIAIGIGMVVTGYVGCFSLVGQSDVENGPYVWFGLESTLSLLRTFLWGSNPIWDEKTSLKMLLKLHPDDDSDSDTLFPLVTSPYDGSQLRMKIDEQLDSPQAFVVYNEADFLGMATAWVGPLQRLELNAVSLFYSILLHDEKKQLYTTIHFIDSRTTLTFSPSEDDFDIFSSTLDTDPITRAVLVTIRHRILKNVDVFINSQHYHQVVDHSRLLSARLFDRRQDARTLTVGWNLLTFPHFNGGNRPTKPLSKHDGTYMDLQRSWTLKNDYCEARGTVLQRLNERDDEYREKEVILLRWTKRPASFFGEVLHIVETVILELHLWQEEREFARTRESLLSRQILPECIRAMQRRMASSRDWALARYSRCNWSGTATEPLIRQWEHVEQMLVKLRESDTIHATADQLWRHVLLDELSSADPDSVRELAEHLDDIMHECLLDIWITRMLDAITNNTSRSSILNSLSLEASTSESPIQITTPGPLQKLDVMMRLTFYRLREFLGSGFREVQKTATTWSAFCTDVLDSSSWKPYVQFDRLSGYALRMLQWHIYSPLIAIEIDASFYHIERQEGGDNRYEDPLLDETLQAKGITTFIIRFSNYLDSKELEAICKSLDKASNVICLAGIGCHQPELDESCEAQHCRAISSNRRSWKTRIFELEDPPFNYTVGYEAQDSGDIRAKGDYIRLYDTARCLILFYCPHAGELTVTLYVRKRSRKITLNASLRSDNNAAPIDTTEYVIPPREKKGELGRVSLHFTGVSQGCGKVLVNGDRVWKAYDVSVQHNPTNDDEKDRLEALDSAEGGPAGVVAETDEATEEGTTGSRSKEPNIQSEEDSNDQSAKGDGLKTEVSRSAERENARGDEQTRIDA
ncbi:hypothetical protein VNI00_006542 [Paramarasmius palmivorus]|uniref:Uncharacterized protein n=1 Tax=Paramarasmius palmivorus TaxID=297713 RepID=A0AAW0D4Y8_9AGAR